MEKKPCVRCERLIDPVARLCPYCNWDQDVPAPRQSPLVSAAAMEERDEQRSAQRRQGLRKVLTIAGIAAVLLATFAIGGFVTRLGKKAEDKKPADIGTTEPTQPPRTPNAVTDLRLVSVDLTSTVGRSITSAPEPVGAPGPITAGNRSDTTALPSQQYAELAQRASEVAQAPQAERADTLDPRTIRPAPPPQPRPQPSTQPATPPRTVPATPPPTARERPGDSVRRTRPEPISQPLPDINVSGTARFRLRIAPDGSVREVEVIQTIPGATAQLVAAVQRWKFRPATEDGEPVEGTHLVDVTFKEDR